LLPFLNLAIILAYYAYFIMHNPQLARNEVRTIDYFTQADLVWQSIIYYFHTKQSFAFQNALQVNHILFSNVKYWCYALWTAGLGVLLVWKSNKDVLVHTRTTRAIIMGLSLCVVPLLPFFVLNYYYLANRNIFLSLLGLSIIGQALFDLLIKKQWLKNGILACLVLLLVLLNISEVACYKELNAVDRHICSQILAQVGEQNIRPENTLLVLNTRATYIDIKSNASIANASSCDWGLLGLMQVMLNRVTSMSIVCAPHGSPFVYDPNKAYTAIVGIDHENNVLPLILKQNAHNKNVIVTSKNGAYFGQLMYVSETQYVYITKGDS
ncbi:MAG: hypothetical protein H7Y41_04515, partial [Hyphomonadaceae bacterium]|nr:hypothetical protein [Clostridia bacterium]